MKKILSLVLALTMFTFPALGEGLDLSSMDLDELTALRDQIDIEIGVKTGKEVRNGYSGVFVGGKNIQVGSYNFICQDDITVCRWPTEDEHNKGKMACEYSNHKKDDIVVVYIGEGMVVEIYGGTVNIQPATEAWVPTAP
jgi:hypothetical protein